MPRILVHTLLFMFVFCASCGGQNKSDLLKEKNNSETKNTASSPGYSKSYIHTHYEYTDSIGKRLIIQNSLPKGGIRYTDPNGEAYAYTIFWTRIINETDNTLELKIDFPVNSYELPSLPGRYFETLLPSDTMTQDKEHLFDYGLTDLASFFDRTIHKPSSLKRSIHPKASGSFYVVVLCLLEGTMGARRAELSLKGQNLYYRISQFDSVPSLPLIADKEMLCGSINLKKFMLRK